MYGNMLEWLVKECDQAIKTRLDQLPVKCKIEKCPMVYWVGAINHSGFEENRATAIHKFNLVLESIVKLYTNMRVMKLKDGYNTTNTNLIINDRSFSTLGHEAIWSGIDLAFKFNATKREEFITRMKVKENQEKNSIQKTNLNRPQEMNDFFTRKRNQEDLRNRLPRIQGHDNCYQKIGNKRRNNDRFLLPKPKFYKGFNGMF